MPNPWNCLCLRCKNINQNYLLQNRTATTTLLNLIKMHLTSRQREVTQRALEKFYKSKQRSWVLMVREFDTNMLLWFVTLLQSHGDYVNLLNLLDAKSSNSGNRRCEEKIWFNDKAPPIEKSKQNAIRKFRSFYGKSLKTDFNYSE